MAASENKLVVFKGKNIRRTLHKNEWWFVVADVVEALTDTPNASDYIKKMRGRDDELAKGWGQIVTPLEVETAPLKGAERSPVMHEGNWRSKAAAGWFQRETISPKNHRGKNLGSGEIT
ncbi:MAG: hypothetical protein HYT76_08545 [Deltaproteobacteria bacterium]|nr:hypothetical protein [Deltaproteobacteria bacterium]